jgi:hypothetical protein
MSEAAELFHAGGRTDAQTDMNAPKNTRKSSNGTRGQVMTPAIIPPIHDIFVFNSYKSMQNNCKSYTSSKHYVGTLFYLTTTVSHFQSAHFYYKIKTCIEQSVCQMRRARRNRIQTVPASSLDAESRKLPSTAAWPAVTRKFLSKWCELSDKIMPL